MALVMGNGYNPLDYHPGWHIVFLILYLASSSSQLLGRKMATKPGKAGKDLGCSFESALLRKQAEWAWQGATFCSLPSFSRLLSLPWDVACSMQLLCASLSPWPQARGSMEFEDVLSCEHWKKRLLVVPAARLASSLR